VRQLGDQIPGKFEMEQNYPNPFNPSTTIKYALNKLSNVNLSIYNMLGQKVMELINTQQTAGTYEVKFDGASLSSGIYFYSLSNGSSLITKKMMLLK
ncbi:MAG: T9SS type A sorting domain-containing protein, partial [Ignavibacteriaceae bacterium]